MDFSGRGRSLFCFLELCWSGFWWRDASIADIKVGMSALIGVLKPGIGGDQSPGRVCGRGKQGPSPGTPVTFRSQTVNEQAKEFEKE